MMRHSADYLEMLSTLVVGWQWLKQAAVAAQRNEKDHDDLRAGKLQAARYFLRTELPRIDHLAELCVTAEDSYAAMKPEWF